MPWNSATHRLTAPVSIDDIRLALGLSAGEGYTDLGGLVRWAVRNGLVNKWAKWKPLRSSEPLLSHPSDTSAADDMRRTAGRKQLVYDEGLVYGVRGGVGQEFAIADIHGQTFAYEGADGYDHPDVATLDSRGQAWRIDDWVHPVDALKTTYGYRSDAHCDLQGDIILFGDHADIIIVGQPDGDSSFEAEIVYYPHSATEREEMLSIRDFLTNNIIEYDPLDCYPVVLITNNAGESYLHCLYPASQSGTRLTPTPLSGADSNNLWKLNVPSDSEKFPLNTQCTMSVALVYCNSTVGGVPTLIAGDPDYRIDQWIAYPANDSERLWAAWFCGVPDSCGLTARLKANALGIPLFNLSQPAYTSTGFGFSGTFDSDSSRSLTLTLTVSLFSDSDRRTQLDSAASDPISYPSGVSSERAYVGPSFEWSDFTNIVWLPGQTVYATIAATVTDVLTGNTEVTYLDTTITHP